MKSEKRKSVYSILSKVLNLKFHTQLKESGIEFTSLYKMTNLVTGQENYLVYVNKTELRFVTTRDFIFHFSRLLVDNIKTLAARHKELINIQTNEFTDDIGIEFAYKEAEYQIMKQTELLDKMNEFKTALF